MSKRKHKHNKIIKLTKQQIELAERQYWAKYNNYKQNQMLNG